MTKRKAGSNPASSAPLGQSLKAIPKVCDRPAALARFRDLASDSTSVCSDDLIARRPVRGLLLAIADHSPFLWRLIRSDPARLARLLAVSPETSLDVLIARLLDQMSRASSDEEAMRALRLARQEAALLIALADLGGVWPVDQVVHAISRFADAAVREAFNWLLRQAAGLAPREAVDLASVCGAFVLALGKHGAGELNYSSDIDLIVFFDPDNAAAPSASDSGQFYVRLIKALTRLLQERTADGYVFRVDLRLRPDPGSTAVAVAIPAAYSYYENLGQNWERAAFIKARPIAGNIELGKEFLKSLEPFIWRKYFDYGAIADIHAMKRQIHAVRGHDQITVLGHDVKLGRGGIREVEFFVQTQQLIFGGRKPVLRGARTLEMLDALHREAWISEAARLDLALAYRVLRSIEHRLQMIDDQQTQRLPRGEPELTRFAFFCGFPDAAAFSDYLQSWMRKVETHYARLFEGSPSLGTDEGSLMFAGPTDDQETLLTLKKMGFADPVRVSDTVRGWHFGRRPAVQSPRAREVLTELVPSLLKSFASSSDPDAALAGFDSALSHMPAAVELFSILKANDNIRNLFSDILGGAPRLAAIVAARPHVLDSAIDPSLPLASTDVTPYETRIRTNAGGKRSFEDFLDIVRDIVRDEQFTIAVRTFSNALDPLEAGTAFTALAEACVRATCDRVMLEFTREYGSVQNGKYVVVALGRLGSREMTATSDLDLMLLYEFDDETPMSTGRVSIHAAQYFSRFTQRLISALTVPTRRGGLYEVDMRLRPSGRKGPLATRLRSFLDYQATEAEAWEHLALVRARILQGDGALVGRVNADIGRILSLHRDKALFRKDVAGMRRLIAQEKGEDDPWDFKLMSGGLIDIEFVAQYLRLVSGDLLSSGGTDIRNLLRLAGEQGLVSVSDAHVMIEAHSLYSRVMQVSRVATGGSFKPEAAGASVRLRIAQSLGMPDFPHVAAEIAARRPIVRGIFKTVMSGPVA